LRCQSLRRLDQAHRAALLGSRFLEATLFLVRDSNRFDDHCHITVHGLHVLVQYVHAMTELKRNSNLIPYLNYLAFRKSLTALVSKVCLVTRIQNIRSSPQHLYLSVQILPPIVIHEERQCISLAIVLESIMQGRNVRRPTQRFHMIILVQGSFCILTLNLLASDNLTGQLRSTVRPGYTPRHRARL
jgi:hypothetical protein